MIFGVTRYCLPGGVNKVQYLPGPRMQLLSGILSGSIFVKKSSQGVRAFESKYSRGLNNFQ